jgi:hypothetical protein
MSFTPCQHDWRFAAVVWSLAGTPLMEVGAKLARPHVYEDRLYCTRCALHWDQNSREFGDTFTHSPAAGTVPK